MRLLIATRRVRFLYGVPISIPIIFPLTLPPLSPYNFLMTNLYAIYATVTDNSIGTSGFLGTLTDPKKPRINVVVIEHEVEFLTFFSKNAAERYRVDIIDAIQRKWPNKAGGVFFDVREKAFSDKKIQQMMTGTYPDEEDGEEEDGQV